MNTYFLRNIPLSQLPYYSELLHILKRNWQAKVCHVSKITGLISSSKCKLSSLNVVFLQLTTMYFVMGSSHSSVFQEWTITNYIYISLQYLFMCPLYFLPMDFKYGHFYDMKTIKLHMYTYIYIHIYIIYIIYIYII